LEIPLSLHGPWFWKKSWMWKVNANIFSSVRLTLLYFKPCSLGSLLCSLEVMPAEENSSTMASNWSAVRAAPQLGSRLARQVRKVRGYEHTTNWHFYTSMLVSSSKIIVQSTCTSKMLEHSSRRSSRWRSTHGEVSRNCNHQSVYRKVDFSEHPDHASWESPKCGPETHPKSKMLERACSRRWAPTQRQLCPALCCATSDTKNTRLCTNVALKRVLLDSDKSTDECADWTHRCAIRKNRPYTQQADRLQLTVPLWSVSYE